MIRGVMMQVTERQEEDDRETGGRDDNGEMTQSGRKGWKGDTGRKGDVRDDRESR